MSEGLGFSPEKQSQTDYKLLLLPELPGYSECERAKTEERDNLSRLKDNLNFINQVPDVLLNRIERQARDEINRYFPYYKHRLEGIMTSTQTRENVQSAFGERLEPVSDVMEVKRPTEITELLKKRLVQQTGDLFCLSGNHASTFFTMEAVMEVREASEGPLVALVVFDNHPDVFNPEDKSLNEGNVLLAMVTRGTINGAIIVGDQNNSGTVEYANQYLRDEITKAFPEEKEKVENETWFISVGQESVSKQQEETGDTKRQTLESQITAAVDALRQDGVTNVIFSVDIDFLNAKRIGYTGFHYNPLTLMKSLAESKIPLDLDPTKLTQEEADIIFIDILVGLKEALEKRDSGATDEELGEFLDEKTWAHPIFQNLNSPNHDPHSFTMGDFGRAVDQIIKECKFAGIEVGIKLKGGGRFVGDIVGIEGYDYRGFTAKAVKAMTEKLATAAKA